MVNSVALTSKMPFLCRFLCFPGGSLQLPFALECIAVLSPSARALTPFAAFSVSCHLREEAFLCHVSNLPVKMISALGLYALIYGKSILPCLAQQPYLFSIRHQKQSILMTTSNGGRSRIA